MSYQAVKYVLEHSEIYGKARMVLICLAEHTNVDGLTWPGVDLISRECRMRKTEIRDSVHLLLRSREIVEIQEARPRSPAKYLMIRFCETPNVGAPTVQIIREPGEGIPRDLSVPGAKNKVYSVPAKQIYRERVGRSRLIQWELPGGSDCFNGNRVGRQKDPLGIAQGVPTLVNSVPTVSVGTPNHQNHKVSVPAFQSGNGNRHSLAAAACASSGAADGLAPSSPSRSYLRPTNPPSHQSRSPRALESMREILRHAAAAADGKEPFDFVGPDYVPEEGEE